MSATNRGTIRDPKDFYPTDRKAVIPLLQHLPRGVKFWEPCAGDGRLIQMLRDSGREADGRDLFPQVSEYYLPIAVDYLGDETMREFVLTNPPFSIAFDMCKHAMEHARELMFLLRLSFLESEDRGDWFEQHEPNGLWVLKKRPSFVMSITCKTQLAADKCLHNWIIPIESERPKVCPKCGGSKLAISTSDSSGYAWYYWGPRQELSGIHHI